MGALLVTDIGTADFVASPGDWKSDVPRDINVYINGDAYPTAAESQKVTPQNRDAGTTIVNGKFTVQLIFRIDPLERQVSLPDTINEGEFGRAARQNTQYCKGEQCNYSSEFEIVDPTATPTFTELQKINRNQGRRTAGSTGENHKRVTAVPRLSKPSVNQMLISTSTSRTTVRYPFPITPEIHLVGRTQTTNDEWARRTQARTPNVRTTTARYPVSFDSNEEGFLLEQRYHRTTEKSRAEVNRRKPQTWTLSDTEILFKEKTKETDSYGNRKRQITGEGSAATFSDKDSDGIHTSEFNQPVFRTAGKFLTVFPLDIPTQTTDITPVAEHSGGGTSNPEQHDSSTPVPSKRQVNQTTDNWTVSEHPSSPVPCEELDYLPWERRDKFEVQINPRTKEVVNIRVHTIAGNSKPVIKPSEEYKDSRSTETPLPPSSASGKDEEFPWRHRDDDGVQINPNTEQVVDIRIQPNTTNRPTVRPDERHEVHDGTQSATEATEAALKRTITNTRHDELTWMDRQDHQVQIDPKTGQVVNIRTQYKTQPNLRIHEHQVDSMTEAAARQAVSTPRVTTQAPLPIPFFHRKQISSQSGDSDFISSNLTRDDVQTEIKTVIHDHNPNPPPLPEPSEEPKELPWQQKDGFEVQVNPVTKKIINFRTRTVENGHSIPIPVLAAQPTLPGSAWMTTTLISETSWDSHESLSTLEDSHEVQTRENVQRKDVAKIMTPISRNNGGQITTDLIVPTAESAVFPWKQRDDYEVQTDPKTKQIVNIRLRTTTTDNPISKSAGDSIRSQTGDRVRTIDIGRVVKPDDEHDDVFVEPSGSILDRNSKIRTQVQTDDDLPDGPRLRTAVITGSNQKNTAMRSSINGGGRTMKTRKPIFSHSDADGVLYFRFADNDDLWEELEVKQFNGDAKFVLVDEDDWISARRGRGRDSPYFYFSQGNSSSISFSCYIVLLIACLVSFIS